MLSFVYQRAKKQVGKVLNSLSKAFSGNGQPLSNKKSRAKLKRERRRERGMAREAMEALPVLTKSEIKQREIKEKKGSKRKDQKAKKRDGGKRVARRPFWWLSFWWYA